MRRHLRHGGLAIAVLQMQSYANKARVNKSLIMQNLTFLLRNRVLKVSS